MGHVLVVKSIQQMYLDHIVKFKVVSESNKALKWQSLMTRKSKFSDILERKMQWMFSRYSNWILAQSKHSLWCYEIIHDIFKVKLNMWMFQVTLLFWACSRGWLERPSKAVWLDQKSFKHQFFKCVPCRM